MPPSRRSQNHTLEPPATPTKTPGRARRNPNPTAKRVENAAQERQRKEKHDREQAENARKEGPSRVDRLTAAADELLRKNGNNKATQMARRRANVARHAEWDRARETRQRIEAQKAKEQEEWEAEVAQFGELEAKRRRQEELEMRRQQEDLPTSDLEQLELDEKVANPVFTVSASLRVNKRLEWQSVLGKYTNSAFSVSDFETKLEEVFDKNEGYEKGWRIITRQVIIRANHSRARREIQSLDDFSETEWDKIITIILAQAERFVPDLDIKIEVLAESELTNQKPFKRPRDILSSDPIEQPPPKSRATRTDNLLDRQRAKVDALALMGNLDHQLLQRWQCHDDRCRNYNGWCFVDYLNKHYNMDPIQQSTWAKAITNGEYNVSIERPPATLYQYWTGSQGAVNAESRRPIRQTQREEDKAQNAGFKDMISTFMEFNKQQLEMQLADRMADQMERMGARQRPVYTPHPPLPSTPPYTQWQPSLPAQQPQPQPQLPPLPPPVQHPPLQHPPSLPRSSPIGPPEEEEAILQHFFEWKMENTRSERTRQRLQDVADTVQAEMWCMNDLISMADPSCALYQLARQLGVPDGLARGFKADLKEFKPRYRQARVLMNMRR